MKRMDTDNKYNYVYLTLNELCSHLKLNISIERNEENLKIIRDFFEQNREIILSSKKLNKSLYFSSSSYISFDNLDEKGWDILLRLYDYFFIQKKYINHIVDEIQLENNKEKELVKNLTSFIESKGIIETNTANFINDKELLKIINYNDIKSGKINKNVLYTIFSNSLEKIKENSKLDKNDKVYQNKINKLEEDIEKIKTL
jgi:hypothetical protein